MKEQQEKAIAYLKTLDIDGCMTGSCLLGYFEGSDIDVFCYSEASFTKLLYTLSFNPMFSIIDKIEKWKFNDWCNSSYKSSIKKMGICTIKFHWNLCMPVNIIFKEKANNIFSVLSSFDMDIIAKGYDLMSKQYLDLTEKGKAHDKIATWNKWNPTFNNPNVWNINRILRQFKRVIKYQNRGYDTDLITKKYLEILNDILSYENIFNSSKVDEKVTSVKESSTILIAILNKWLETHTITAKELELLDETIKKL